MLLPRPAPVSTTTRWPPSTSARTPAGVSATRCSPGLISRGTPTITTTPPSQRTPEEAGEPSLEARGQLAMATALDEVELRARVAGQRGAQPLGVAEGNLLVLVAVHEQDGHGEAAGRVERPRSRDVGAEQQARPQQHALHEWIARQPHPRVQLVAEGPEVGEGRIGGDGADAGVLGGGQQRDGAAE